MENTREVRVMYALSENKGKRSRLLQTCTIGAKLDEYKQKKQKTLKSRYFLESSTYP